MKFLFFNIVVVSLVAQILHASQDGLGFALPSVDGDVVELATGHENELTVVCFVGNECPLARHYVKRLSDMSDGFRDQKIRFLGINSNQQDSMDELKTFASELDVKFKLLKDFDNKVANKFDARRTPEVFLLNSRLEVIYRGRVDDQYSPGVNRSVATKHFLKQAIDDALSSRPISLAATEVVGCIIGRTKQPIENPTVTYTNQVSRVIQKHCLECHRSGEIGPFALDSYDEVKGWAEMMLEVVEEGRMPPWHATSDSASFLNARHLDDQEKAVFRDWLEQGTPFGDATELPRKITFTNGWRLPKDPDIVVEMRDRPFEIPATGTVEYQYFVVDPGFEKDTWVAAAEVIPGNRAVVHHSIVFVRPPDGTPFRGIGWLAAYVPGQGNLKLNERHARRIPAGSKLVFQQHYTPTGTPELDTTKIGLVFADPDKVTHEIYTIAGLNQEFEIPADSQDHLVRSILPRFPKNGHLISIAPHMHYRGKSFKLLCDGGEGNGTLLDVPAYDFNWQHVYQFREPLPLSGVKKFAMEFRFDNSEDNPFNPNSKELVTWGDQTWEEMAVAFFEVAEPRKELRSSVKQTTSKSNVESEEKATQFVDEFFERFDANGDDELIRDELPRAIRRFKFGYYDQNGDGKLVKSELVEFARRRFSNN